MKKTGLLLCLLSLMLSCNSEYNKNQNPNRYIPNNTSAIFEIKELNEFLNTIENHEILHTLYNKKLILASKTLKHLSPKQTIYVALSAQQDSSSYLILTQNDSTLFVTDSLRRYVSETFKESNIEKSTIDSTTFYHKKFENIFAASNNLDLLKKLNKNENNNEFVDLLETTSNKAVASIVFKSGSKTFSKLLFNFTNTKNSNTYSVLDLYYGSKQLKYNGISVSADSSSTTLDAFKNTVPQAIRSPEISPSSVNSLTSLTFNNYSVFNKKDSIQNFLKFSNEIALYESNKNKAIIVHSLDPNLVLESITQRSNSETFRDIDIYNFESSNFFKERLQPFFTLDSTNYFALYDEFIVFSNDIETIKSILTDALNNNTLAKNDAYLNLRENLSDEASIFIYKNADAISEVFKKNLKNYSSNAVQFIYEKDYAHINGIVQEYKKRATTNSVSESFTTKLNADLIAPPQTTENHVSRAHDIIAQDVNNILYLVSNSGSILWEKQLPGKILGKVEQMDMYKNGRLQLVFATKNRVYVLDRNGNDVSPFPLKFNDAITQPLSVFDYDNNKNYRLLVTQGKELLMYDDRGNTVNGFDYKSNGKRVTSQPQHFRIGSKDFIVFKTENKLKLLNRQGNIRIPVNESFNFSDNEIFLYQNKFSTTNTLGELMQINTSGKLNKKNLNLSDKHKLITTSKTLVTLTENKLNIKARTVDLDFGNYTEPRIFYLNDKIYVSVTDLQAKKVYLFDSQAKPIPNFPVFGTSAAELQKLDNENGLELITQSDSDTILVYKIY